MQEPIKILFVDDDEDEFIILKDLLSEIKNQKYILETASSYDKGIEKLKEESFFDICLIDYRLGTKSGVELLKYIKDSAPNVPVILLTGMEDVKVDLEAMEMGASDYLVKDKINANLLERSIRYSIAQTKTQQQLLEREKNLREAEKFAITGRIALVIAHEVRNPLTNIQLALHQLKDETKAIDGTFSMLFDVAERNCHRINELITNLLESTKFSELKNESVSINELLDETINLAIDRIELKNIKIIKHYAFDICNVNLDKEKIKIALLNIIINSLEAMDKKESILTVSTASKNKKCIITIQDNGKGMSVEDLNSIFEPYYSKKEGGMGLGLTTSQTIIYNHEGTIGVESKEGWGTIFTITFNLHTS